MYVTGLHNVDAHCLESRRIIHNACGFSSWYIGMYGSGLMFPMPDFISHPLKKNQAEKSESNYSPIFLHGCEIKSGRGRPGYEVTYVHSQWLHP